MDGIAEMYGIDKQQAIDTIVASAQTAVDDAAISTRMTEEALAGVLYGLDNRFKTQFDTGRPVGC